MFNNIYRLIVIILCFPVTIYAQISANGLPLSEHIRTYPIEVLNSDFRDVNLSITPDGQYLYFMSGRGGTVWSVKDRVTFRGKTEYDGDIWYSEKQDTSWAKPKYLPSGINTSRGEDEPNISPDGQTVYFQSWNNNWMQTGGPYYRAELYGSRWQNPAGLFGGIHRFFMDSMLYYNQFATDGMAISPNGRIFIVAAGENYDGDLDLYISRKGNTNKWSYPKRLSISTPYDERSVFIAGDNRTIYFGSSGHGGSGGLDIFKATLNEDDSVTDLINIGTPFNTDQHDYGFIIGALGNDAYFVRNSDIYYANLGEASELIKPQPTLLINGIVKDCNGQLAQARVMLYDLGSSQLLAEARSNALTGAYALSIPYEMGNYRQRFEYFMDTTVVNNDFVVAEGGEQKRFFTIEPECPKPIIEPPITKAVLPKLDTLIRVYFDFDQDQLTSMATQQLVELQQLLSHNSEYQITIIGHTDAKGSDAYNMNLSRRRAQTVLDFLAIAPQQEVDFKGEQEPAMDNDTAAHRAMNRRVSIRVVEQ
jgi:outer membrane protein OmpA-like peptidoglycan-associated protein